MPTDARTSTVVRVVQGLRGSVAMQLILALRFDYGRLEPWIEPSEHGFIATAGAHAARFSSTVPVVIHESKAIAEFEMGAGRQLEFVLQYFSSHESPPRPEDGARLLEGAGAHSQAWIARLSPPARWRDSIERSLLTLRALIYRPTGGLVAAPTTSLPEKPGGSMNWDYRYCWLRDSTFTLTALLNAGYQEEARRWRDWILRAVAADPAQMNIMYQIDGAPSHGERNLDWLPGYRWAIPVRVGNAAADQVQIDVYGELIDAMDLCARAGIEQTEQGATIEAGIVRHLTKVWNQPGQGLWESRDAPRHYTYSRAMAWVGIDRFRRRAAQRPGADVAWLTELETLQARIHEEVCTEGYHEGLGTFVQSYGGQALDASLLLLPIIGFLPATDPRIARTIAAIERDLVMDGFVMRQKPTGSESEGAFLACTCWLADCQRLQGRVEDAVTSLERVLAVRNDLGLLSEEYNTAGRHLAGNFPQALTHLAVINTALGLLGPTLQRGAG